MLAVIVSVCGVDHTNGYTSIEVEAGFLQPCSFTVGYDVETGRYLFKQTGENNSWSCYPDERK